MKTVGAFEGKTHFSALIDAAERGETTLITKNGRLVARIAPLEQSLTFREALKPIHAAKLKLGMPLRKAIELGRR